MSLQRRLAPIDILVWCICHGQGHLRLLSRFGKAGTVHGRYILWTRHPDFTSLHTLDFEATQAILRSVHA